MPRSMVSNPGGDIECSAHILQQNEKKDKKFQHIDTCSAVEWSRIIEIIRKKGFAQ